MKFTILLTFILFDGLLFGQFSADGPKEAVIGSKHDLRRLVKGNSDKISACEYCHPEPQAISSESSQAWNQQSKIIRFSSYATPKFDVSDSSVPTSDSGRRAGNATAMCLSCHDGVVSDAAMDSNLAVGGTSPTSAGLQSVLDLSGGHPVQFTYSYQLANTHRGLQPPVEGVGVPTPYVGRSTSLPLYKQSPSDESGRMECATCHDPHNGKETYFLRMNNTGSALCLNCH